MFIVAYYVLTGTIFWYFEGWGVVDCIYFISSSVTTVGYGDLSLQNSTSRLIGIPTLLFGIVVIFSNVGDIITSTIERAEEKAMKAADRNDEDLAQPLWVKVLISVTLFLVCFLLGVVVVAWEEHYTLIDRIWWSFQTITTCGFGDLSPLQHAYTKLAASVFMMLSVAIVAASIGQVASAYSDIKRQAQRQEKLRRIDFDTLKQMDQDGGGVDLREYIIGMLKILGEVDDALFAALTAQFNEQDKDSSGMLDSKDLTIIAEQRKAEHEAEMLELQKGCLHNLLSRVMPKLLLRDQQTKCAPGPFRFQTRIPCT